MSPTMIPLHLASPTIFRRAGERSQNRDRAVRPQSGGYDHVMLETTQIRAWNPVPRLPHSAGLRASWTDTSGVPGGLRFLMMRRVA